MYCNFSCLSGDDGSTCIPITGNNVEIVASQDSSINSKARGSNKVASHIVSKEIIMSVKCTKKKSRNVGTCSTDNVRQRSWL